MKSVLVIDSGRYPDHRDISEVYRCILERWTGECVVIDMGEDDRPLHEKFQEISDAAADWLMTFDLAGFECRLGLGGASFNRLPCRMAHLLLQEPDETAISPEETFNFSMYFYAVQEDCAQRLRRRYPQIENIKCIPGAGKPGGAEESLRVIFDDTEMSLDFKECQLS